MSNYRSRSYLLGDNSLTAKTRFLNLCIGWDTVKPSTFVSFNQNVRFSLLLAHFYLNQNTRARLNPHRRCIFYAAHMFLVCRVRYARNVFVDRANIRPQRFKIVLASAITMPR